MQDIKFQILRTQEFNGWLESQAEVTQSLVLARLHRLSIDGHFGVTNHFDGLIELKWKSGLRLYVARISKTTIVILGGGNKNGQNKDIKQVKKILNKIKRTSVGSS